MEALVTEEARISAAKKVNKQERFLLAEHGKEEAEAELAVLLVEANDIEHQVRLALFEQGWLDSELQQACKEIFELEVLKEDNVMLALEIERRYAQLVTVEEKHQVDTKELV